MAHSFFIDEQYLKDNSPLSGNVDIQEIYPYAKTVEKMYIQDAIGTSLYNDLTTKINADEDLSGYPDEKTLVLKIREAVLWYTVYEALPFIAIKLRNIGVVKQTGEGHESATRDDVSYLRKECKNKGDFFLKRVQDYLCEFKSLYPAYDLTPDDEMPANLNSPTPSCDIAFDNNDGQMKYYEYYRKWIKA